MIRGDHDEDIYVGGVYMKKIFCIGPSTKDEICEVQVVVATSECMIYHFVDSAGCVCIVRECVCARCMVHNDVDSCRMIRNPYPFDSP